MGLFFSFFSFFCFFFFLCASSSCASPPAASRRAQSAPQSRNGNPPTSQLADSATRARAAKMRHQLEGATLARSAGPLWCLIEGAGRKRGRRWWAWPRVGQRKREREERVEAPSDKLPLLGLIRAARQTSLQKGGKTLKTASER